MRFLRLRARVFGPLEGVELDFDSDAVVVFGRNETGKSTLRSAFETILYGFEPASREKHPLYCWNDGAAGDLHLEADLRVDDRVLAVERLLQSNGKLRVASGGAEFDGPRSSNKALPCVADVPRELYRSIYALELEQLEALGESVQVHVDDLLLPEADALGLLPVFRIKQDLRSDHGRLWKADRSRSPKAQQLRAGLNEAREDLGRARSLELELRDARAERALLQDELERIRSRKRVLEEERAETPYLLMLFELGQRWRALRERPVDLTPLGDTPLVAPQPLREEIEDLEQKLREPRGRLAAGEMKLGESVDAILVAEPLLDAAMVGSAVHMAERSLREERYARAKTERESARRELATCLSESAKEVHVNAADAVPLEALRATQAGWLEVWDHPAHDPTARRRLRWLTILPASLAAGALGAMAYGKLPIDPTTLGGAAALVLLTALAAVWPRRSRAETAPQPEGLEEILHGLPISDELLTRPSDLQRFCDALARVQQMLSEAREAEASAERLEAAQRERERTWVELCERFGLSTDGDGEALVSRLQTALEAARKSAQAVERDRDERLHAQGVLDTYAPTLDRKRDHLARLERTLQAVEPDATDSTDAFERLHERIAEAKILRAREVELRQDSRWEVFSADRRVTAETLPDDAPWIPEIAARRDAELEATEERVQEIANRLGELRVTLGDDAGSHEARALDAVEEIRSELRRVERERDRLALLESVLERAEQVFRDEHQPDVVRRASQYLERVTLGRYRRLDFEALPSGGLHVTPRDGGEPVPVTAPLSRGTLDQIFLCLRLGLLDHLDEDRDKPPLILDDSLLRMDDTRRIEVYRVLAEVTPKRQVILLTCHRAIADEATRALGARRIDLPS